MTNLLKKFITTRRFLPIILSLFLAHSAAAEIKLDFSHERGYYNNTFQLLIASDDPSATIRYTTDQSKPSNTNGSTYSGPISINGTTTLRVFASSASDQSKVISQSYLFITDIVNDTSMYTYITQSSTYGPQMEASLQSLPVISLITNSISSETAISTEVETSVEMFWPDDSRKGFMLHSGIQTWGGSPTNPKKNYRLEFKEIYGEKSLDYDIFKTDNYDDTEYRIKPTEKFDKLVLRAGSQDGLNAEYGDESLAQFVRNRVMFDAQIGLGELAAHGRFVHVFVNGQYGGQYHLMERPDAGFLESYLGGDKEDYESRQNNGYWDGDGTFYNSIAANIDFSTAAGMQATRDYVDLDNAANYLVMMSYASGFDWSVNHNSLSGGNTTVGLGGYKFIMYDVDFCLGNGGKWHPSYGGDLSYFDAPFNDDGPVPNGMRTELEFKQIMADKLECACYNDGILTANIMDSLFLRRTQQVELSLIAESARWGDRTFTFGSNGNNHIAKTEWDVNDEFNTERNRVRNTYISDRTDSMLVAWESNNYKSNLEGVVMNQYGGIVAQNFSLSLSNPNSNGSIYYTLDGSDPRAFGGGISTSAILYNGAIVLADGRVEVKARVHNPSAAITSIDRWSGLCPRTFYVNQEYSKLAINEIHYHPNDSIFFNPTISAMDTVGSKNFEFIEVKNYGTAPINFSNVHFKEGIYYKNEADLIIPPNGFVVLAQDADWFLARYGFSPDGEYDGKLDNGGEFISLHNPDGEIIDSLTYNDKSPWPEDADLGIMSLGLKNALSNNNNPSNWSIQVVPFTPNAENDFDLNHAYFGVQINEIHYHPNDSILGATVIDDDVFEFIELKNLTNNPIDLSDFFLANAVQYTFPTGTTIAAGGFLVIGTDSVFFNARYNSYPNGTFDGKLKNSGDEVWLFSADGNLVDAVNYDDGNPWDDKPDGSPYSLALYVDSLQNNLASNWSAQSKEVTLWAENEFTITIEGTVFNDDSNNGQIGGNGIQTADNNSLYLNLIDGGNLVVQSQALSNSGGYQFLDVDPNLNYSIQLSINQATIGNSAPALTLPLGWLYVGEDCCDNNGNDGNSDGVLQMNNLSGDDILNANFAIRESLALGNQVWNDINQNGIKENTEIGIANAQVKLYLDADNNGVVDGASIESTTTNSSGLYFFENLYPGNYIVGVIPPLVSPAYKSSPINELNPNLNIDNNDNGINSFGTEVRSATIALSQGQESLQEANDNNSTPDENSNLSLDFGFYKPLYLSGYVRDDVNGNTNNQVDGAAVPNAVNSTLRVALVANNTVVASTTVGASGFYYFFDVEPNTMYEIILSNSTMAIGNAPSANNLPVGWLFSGESPNINGDDGTPNGKMSRLAITNSVFNNDFGIQLRPNAQNASVSSQVNPGGNTFVSISPSAFGGTDPSNGGSIDRLEITSFPSNVDAIQVGAVQYTSSNFPAAGLSIPTNAQGQPISAISIDPSAGALTVSLMYKVIDNGDAISIGSGTIFIPFTTIDVSGRLFNDIDGLTDNNVDGALIAKLDGQDVYAHLLDASSNVLENVIIANNGAFSFLEVDPNKNYSIAISTNQIATGINFGTSSIPNSWVFTGESPNGPGSDGVVNGQTSFSLASVNLNQIDFGVQQKPIAMNTLAPSVSNVQGNAQVPLPANLFGGSDPSVGGTIQNLRICTFPSGVESIVINSVIYDLISWPVNGVIAQTNIQGQPLYGVSVDPIDGFSTVVISYELIDNGGASSGCSGSLTIPTCEPLTLLSTTQELCLGDQYDLTLDEPSIAQGGQWMKNGSPVSNGIANSSANYHYTYLDPNGCVFEDSLQIIDQTPDYTITLAIAPSAIVGPSQIRTIVNVTEINNTAPCSDIYLLTPKDISRFTFSYSPLASSVGGVAVNNGDWQYFNTNPSFHVWQYIGNEFPSGGISRLGFIGNYNNNNTDGATSFTIQIFGGSGGETNSINNSDSESLIYFK